MKLNKQVILNELEKQNMSQAELARRIDTSRFNLNKYLSHTRNIPRKMAYRIADTLGLDLYEVVEFSGYF